MRKFKLIFTLGIAFFILACPLATKQFTQAASDNNNEGEIVTDASNLPQSDAHKAIVKIKSYVLNSDNKLALFSSGSGAIIDSSGVVLTNRHVVVSENDFDGSKRETSYIICLTKEINQEPVCKYTADLIASNEKLDVALLKINNISGLSNKENFPYLNLSSTDSASTNDEITALGYPSIGGGTITITKGIISGEEEKYNKKWLKTDAITSYGSSGGAAIDSQGEIIGITSAAHSDKLGSLGYIINITALDDWVDSHIKENPQSSSLLNRTAELAQKIVNLKDSNQFSGNNPSYGITKPSDWNFTYEDKTTLFIDKESDDEGGMIMIAPAEFPHKVDTGVVEGAIKRDLSSLLSVITVVKNEDVTINGNKAKKVIISAAGEQMNAYYIPINNYLLEIMYDYGKDDKDKATIDNIINSLTVNDSEQYTENKEYSNNNPEFAIKANNDWALLPKNSKSNPLFITYKADKSAFADIEVTKTDDNTNSLNNEEYLSYIEQKIKEENSLNNRYDLRTEVKKKNAHYELNNTLNNVIMIDTVKKSISTGEILSQNRAYFIKSGDKYVVPSLNYFSSREEDYNKVISEFDNILSSLTLDSSRPGKFEDITEEVTEIVNIKNEAMHKNLKGKIMLKIESDGEAYYIHPTDKKMFYLGRPGDAFSVMRDQGVGISNSDLEKIPAGLSNLTGPDTDGDGLPDLFEDAMGTNKEKADSDGDGYNDKQELENNFDPTQDGGAKFKTSNDFAQKQKGKILLQVEGNGEAWYINPEDGKRYFLGRPRDAFQVMRNLGLGISDKDFESM